MGLEVKFNIFLRLLTNKNIIFMSKIVRLCPHSILTFGDCMWGNFRQSPLNPKIKIIAHRHLCLDMFEGLGLKNVFDRMFLKHLTRNVV